MANAKMVLPLLFLLCLNAAVFADTGPKPTAAITYTYEGQELPDAQFGTRMLTCGARAGLWRGCNETVAGKDTYCAQLAAVNVPDEQRGCNWTMYGMAWTVGWTGNCTRPGCTFHYFLPQEFRLAVYLPSEDRVYVSAPIERENFNSAFSADLRADGTITIEETTPLLKSDLARAVPGFLFALVVTLLLELLVALIYFKLAAIPLATLHSVVWINLITLPFVWFVFTNLFGSEGLLVGEIFAFVAEPFLLRWFSKGTVAWKHAIAATLLANLASLIVGGFLYLYFFRYFI